MIDTAHDEGGGGGISNMAACVLILNLILLSRALSTRERVQCTCLPSET